MTTYSDRSFLRDSLIILAMLVASLAILLAIADLPTAFSVPLQGGYTPAIAIPSANEVHNQLIFLYQASLNGNIAEMERAAAQVRTATWVFEEAEDTGDETPTMPGPNLTAEEIKEVLEILQKGWDVRTVDELKDEFDANAQLVESLTNNLANGLPVSEADIQMGIYTIWAQQILGQRIIALEDK